jgi:predicted nucleic acid-binding Zn finger protein
MDKKLKDFILHKNFCIEPNQPKIIKKKVDIYELVHIQGNVRLIHGKYSLCKHHLIKKVAISERKNYKIRPYKF